MSDTATTMAPMSRSPRPTPTDYPARAAAYRAQAVRWRAGDEAAMVTECEEYARRCDALAALTRKAS